MIKDGCTTITKNDLLGIKHMGMKCGGVDYGLLCLLKDRGAPVIGTTFMRIDTDNYNFNDN